MAQATAQATRATVSIPYALHSLCLQNCSLNVSLMFESPLGLHGRVTTCWHYKHAVCRNCNAGAVDMIVSRRDLRVWCNALSGHSILHTDSRVATACFAELDDLVQPVYGYFVYASLSASITADGKLNSSAGSLIHRQKSVKSSYQAALMCSCLGPDLWHDISFRLCR